ncbi:MAG: CpsB/CapC family capsule biosynthesis tyrosine phosphatase, partial [Bacteroidota bacterium]
MGFIQRLFGGGKADAPGLDVLRVDVHSHLVPAIDDGSKTVEDSVEMIRA